MRFIVNWLTPQLFLVTLVDRAVVCMSDKVTCSSIGCYAQFGNRNECHCDAICHQYDNCCPDFVDCGSCHDIGCAPVYNESRLCQCNSFCWEFKNCCRDYNDTCAPGSPGEVPKDGERFTPSPTAVEVPEEGTSILAAVLPAASGVAVIVSVTVLIIYFLMTRKREGSCLTATNATTKPSEELSYFEIESLHTEIFEEIPVNHEINYPAGLNIANSAFVTSLHDDAGEPVARVTYDREISPDFGQDSRPTAISERDGRNFPPPSDGLISQTCYLTVVS